MIKESPIIIYSMKDSMPDIMKLVSYETLLGVS